MAKMKLDTRLDPKVIERLKSLAASEKLSISDLIDEALDAMEREQKMPETIAERVENIEENLSALVNLLTLLNGKMDEASVNEKERLISLLQLIDKKLLSHDQAEQMRFDKLRPHTF